MSNEILKITKMSTIAELAADTTEVACERASTSMRRLLKETADNDLRVVLKRMIGAIDRAPGEAREWMKISESHMGEQTNPMDASAVAFAGAMAAAVTEIARSLAKVKIQRDQLLEVARHYANPGNYERGRIFRNCTKNEMAQLGKSTTWDCGHTARLAVKDIISTWMPHQDVGRMEQPQCWWDPANFDELLPPFDGCVLRVPTQTHEPTCKLHESETDETDCTCGPPVVNQICSPGGICHCTPSKIEEY